MRTGQLHSHHVRRPFDQRAYAGYSAQQQAYYEQLLRPGMSIADPFGGQAFALAEAATEGRTVWVGDVNPAPLLLASLRDPRLCNRADEHAAWLREATGPLRSRRAPSRPEFCDEWLPARVREELRMTAELLKIAAPRPGEAMLIDALSERERFGLAMLVYVARQIACFRTTDNATWPKPGGLARQLGVGDPLTAGIEDWLAYARDRANREGSLTVAQIDITSPHDVHYPQADLVVTSPPYANRLDYARMWGPELAVLNAMEVLGVQPAGTQLGTNEVRGWRHDAEELATLPDSVRVALDAIRDDDAPYSASYYFPYFARYSLGLDSAIATCAREMLAQDARMVVFIRDTVRRDILFPTADIVRAAATAAGLAPVAEDYAVIRNHIGLRRQRSASSGAHGLAQREWTLVYKQGGA